MALAAGTRLGPYEVLSLLGSGGMGEVYRARDIRLGRDVALKVLPEAFAKDANRMARFRREAQVLAALNHPNIACIYGLEESGMTQALVMELVEGPTLAERIAGSSVGAGLAPPGVEAGLSRQRASGGVKPPLRQEPPQGAPLPVDESLDIAEEIAEALEAAHERGIIHRDLKPANVKVSPDGTVKVLDFGLAKAFNPQDSGSNLNQTDSPTWSIAPSQPGVILGTASYMSPEQARGKSLDKRTDIWAFGCVLYETLTGKQVFGKETVSDTLAAILGGDPDWQALPEGTPANIRVLLRRCLQKDAKLRLHDIADARLEIEDTLKGTAEAGVVREPPRHKNRMRPLPWAVTGLMLGAVMASIVVWSLLSTPRPRPTARLAVTLPPTGRLALEDTPAVALSPDGSRLVYVANRTRTTQLYLRPIDRLEVTAIPGTEGADSPFFSPDGQSVGFFAEGKLKRVALSGGAPLTLSSAPANRGASWGPDDTIIFASSLFSGLFRVSAAGGTPKPLTVPDRKKGEISHRWPQILPGGKAVLFTIGTGYGFDDARIDVLSVETGERRTLVQGGTYARYVPSGHVVYARAGGLLAVPFDLKRLRVTGAPVSVLEGISMDSASGAAEFSFSDDGSLAYVPGSSGAVESTLLWVDRKGLTQPLPAPPHAYFSFRLSPDGRRLAVGITATNPGVWVYDLARGTLTRLAETADFTAGSPIWTRDGKRLTLTFGLSGSRGLYWMPADGSGAAEHLTASENLQVPGSWSPDGRVLAFSELDPTTGFDIWVLRLEGDRKPQAFLQTPANEGLPRFSPDGRWLAYQSDESGRWEIYMQPFPGPGGKLQISTEGGTGPVWARNGRELFYRNGDKMMAVAIETKPTFVAGRPKLLFEGRYEAPYDVSPDDRRFLMVKAGEQESSATQINVVLNWFDELKGLVSKEKK